jgi:hypothetical protein
MMKTKELFSDLVKALFARRRTEEFVCGDCLRNAQCGQAPSEQCVVRAAQIASDRKRMPRRDTFIVG